MSQKGVFLGGEGDAWFSRNQGAGGREWPGGDPLLSALLELPASPAVPVLPRGARILEIGCGEGLRLEWLAANRGCECHGIDPSQQAVNAAQARGIRATRGTAERLEFDDASFDLVMFGFCLYLCDREDLFRIASEADRVLRNPGWLAIYDFYAPQPTSRAYHHHAGVLSHKMDYRRLFDWNPAYTNYSQRVQHHASGQLTDEPGEWVAVSILRKHLGA
jgi:ubiquinone/menaquinone biosynthesis C-methylase UbiE